MEHQRTKLQQTIEINQIITMYYFEYGRDYAFNGEQHDFWEFLYIDKGEVQVTGGTTSHLLKQGMVIFHKPNEFHSFYAQRGTAPNLIVMTFDCKSEAMKRFENKIIMLQDEERNLLAEIINEGANSFDFPFRYPLVRREEQPIGSEQLIKNYLEMFLVRLLRKETTTTTETRLSTTSREKIEEDIVSAIVQYLESHIERKISIDELSRSLHIAKTKLKDVFKQKKNTSIMSYASKLKIERAKLLIREESLNITEIAQMLSFSSVHYFSKVFKRRTGMSPSEYAKSVKARISIERFKN